MKNAEKIAHAFADLQRAIDDTCCSVEVRGGDGVKPTVTFQSATNDGVETLAGWFGIHLGWVSSVSGSNEWREGEAVRGDIVIRVYGASRPKKDPAPRDVKASAKLTAALAKVDEVLS